MATYQFDSLDPAPTQLASELKRLRRMGQTFGVSVASPELARRLTAGHLACKSGRRMALVEYALLWQPMPPSKATLVTTTPTLDVIGAMAVLWLRGEGWFISGDVADRCSHIALRTKGFALGVLHGAFGALEVAVGDADLSVTNKVLLVRHYLLTGEFLGEYVTRIKAAS